MNVMDDPSHRAPARHQPDHRQIMTASIDNAHELKIPSEATIQPSTPISLIVLSVPDGGGGAVGGAGAPSSSSTTGAAGSAAIAAAATIPLDRTTCLRQKLKDVTGEGEQEIEDAKNSQGYFVVGRQASTSDVRIQHASISRRHAILYILDDGGGGGRGNGDGDGDGDARKDVGDVGDDGNSAAASSLFSSSKTATTARLFLVDLGGKHGTTVNGRRIANSTTADEAHPPGTELKSGDEIQFGNVGHVFRVQIGKESEDPDDDESGSRRPPPNAVASDERSSSSPAAESLTAAVAVMASQAEIDRSRIEQAGQGLAGRDKRRAEIEAMMDSLNDAPAYYRAPAQEMETPTAAAVGTTGLDHHLDPVESDEEDRALVARLAHRHGLPLTQHLTIPSDMTKTPIAMNRGGSESDDDASPPSMPRAMHSGTVTCLAADATGSRFVVGGTDAHLRFYDFGGMRRNRLEPFLDMIPEEGQILQSAAFSPTGDRILVATSSVQPSVFDRDGECVIQFCRGDMYVSDPSRTVGHSAKVTCVDWHPLERDVVLTGSLDGSARLWNLSGKTQFDKLVSDRVFVAKSGRGQRTAVTCVVFHPGGREFAVGTSCGSIQIWSRSRVSVTRPERAVHDAHRSGGGGGSSNEGKSVTCLAYSLDGLKLASRCVEDSTVRVWNPRTLSRSSHPILTCRDLSAVHDNANVCFSPDGSLLCVGHSILRRTGHARVESGSVQIFQVPSVDGTPSLLSSSPASPLLTVPFDDAAPLMVRWHAKLNQIFVACSDGRVVLFFDPHISSKGGAILVSASKLTRGVDDLTKLLKTKVGSSTAITGEIIAPLTIPRGKPLVESERKRKRLERKDPIKSHEPERPASGKHKAGGQTGGTVTFQQFVADQRVTKAKAIAGKDPREALFHYTEGKNYVGTAYEGNVHKLAEKTAEEEENELSKR
jgi:WD40 repeat protein/pSer/pThr/pTyr-binding forkhead associated (FHA) protein